LGANGVSVIARCMAGASLRWRGNAANRQSIQWAESHAQHFETPIRVSLRIGVRCDPIGAGTAALPVENRESPQS